MELSVGVSHKSAVICASKRLRHEQYKSRAANMKKWRLVISSCQVELVMISNSVYDILLYSQIRTKISEEHITTIEVT